MNYYGSEVSKAARIEPVTPSGSVYVTEPFAAVLEMQSDHPFVCNYVGKIRPAQELWDLPALSPQPRGLEI